MICLVCHKNEAVQDKTFGILPCRLCANRQSSLSSPGALPEFTSTSIKDQRREYYSDTLPWHRKGELDKGAVDRYGVEAVKARGFSEKEIKRAKYVWSGADAANDYYKKY